MISRPNTAMNTTDPARMNTVAGPGRRATPLTAGISTKQQTIAPTMTRRTYRARSNSR